MGTDTFKGKAHYRLGDKALWEHVKRSTKEYMDEHSQEAEDIRHFLIVNRKKAFDASGLDFGENWHWIGTETVRYGTGGFTPHD
jgi:hypothetical protein